LFGEDPAFNTDYVRTPKSLHHEIATLPIGNSLKNRSREFKRRKLDSRAPYLIESATLRLWDSAI
jgi:hypothetical protein